MAKAKKKKPVKSAKKSAKKAAKKSINKKVKKAARVKITKPKGGTERASVRSEILSRGAEGAAVTESTTLDTLCIINGSDNSISLEISVGAEEQTSDMTIKLDDAIVVENHAGNFPSTILGTNKNLNGKKLSIAAVIADTSRKTNFTSLKITLTGGISTDVYNLSKTVDEEGASADYICLIEFFKP